MAEQKKIADYDPRAPIDSCFRCPFYGSDRYVHEGMVHDVHHCRRAYRVIVAAELPQPYWCPLKTGKS